MAYTHDSRDLTPVMTANNTPSPIVVSATSEASSTYAAWKAFEHSSEVWRSSVAPSVGTPQELIIDFGAGNEQYISAYAICDDNATNSDTHPKDWTAQISTNGIDWSIIDTRSGEVTANWTTTTLRYFQCQKATLARYFKISITANGGDTGYVAIYELELFDTRANLCQTMTSNTAPAPYSAFASGEINSSYAAWYAFNKSNATSWQCNAPNSGILSYYFGGDKFIISGISISPQALAQAPKDFTIECSNDNVTWDIVGTYTNQTSWVSGMYKNFTCKCNKSYRFIRINITAVNTAGNYLTIYELKVFGQLKDKCLTPVMTANNAPSPYVASASSEYSSSFAAWYAFDRKSAPGAGTGGGCWVSSAVPSVGSPQWIKIYLGGNLCKVTYVDIQGRDYSAESGLTSPKDFTIQGSIDDVTYTTIGTFSNITNWTNFSANTFPVTVGYWKYIKIVITANNGNASYVIIKNLNIYGEQYSNICATMTSNSLPAPYSCSASSEVDSVYYAAWKAFNKSQAIGDVQQWLSGTGNQTIQYYFGGMSYIFNGICVGECGIDGAQQYNIKDFTIEGSNNGSSWEILKTVTNQTSWTWKEIRFFKFNCSQSYKYLRLNITANNTGIYITIGELEIYGIPAKQIVNGYPDITPAMTAASVPENWAVTATDNMAGYELYKAYNNNNSLNWHAYDVNFPKYNQIKLASPIAFNRIDIASSSDYPQASPQDFEIFGSIDGSLYTLLMSCQGIIWGTSQETKTFRFENNIPYNYCKINCLTIKPGMLGGYAVGIAEVYISREERDDGL